jgi:hypothetical protein
MQEANRERLIEAVLKRKLKDHLAHLHLMGELVRTIFAASGMEGLRKRHRRERVGYSMTSEFGFE